MNAYIYCFSKGFFTKKNFVKTLKKELKNEFGELENGEYVHLNMLFCKANKHYDSYFCVYELSNDFDRLINVLIKVSETYKVHLSCSLSKQDECDIVNYIREKVKDKNINVRASMNV